MIDYDKLVKAIRQSVEADRLRAIDREIDELLDDSDAIGDTVSDVWSVSIGALPPSYTDSQDDVVTVSLSRR